jgi:hypothetical protein
MKSLMKKNTSSAPIRLLALSSVERLRGLDTSGRVIGRALD